METLITCIPNAMQARLAASSADTPSRGPLNYRGERESEKKRYCVLQ